MTTTIRRVLALSIPLLALQLAACNDGLMAPETPDAEPQYLIGQSPLAPFWLAKAPVLNTKKSPTGKTIRELVVELHMDAREADALAKGKRAFQSTAVFQIDGGAVSLGDPHPSPVTGLSSQKDGTMLVVIAMPIDDAAWKQIDANAKSGQAVGIIMDIDLVDPDARGYPKGTYVIHSIEAAGSFTK